MEQEAKELWALVELFGHNRVAGKVTEAEIGGGSLIRVDVPAVRDREPLTKYYNVKAIYALTPVDEATCLEMAKSIDLRRSAAISSTARLSAVSVLEMAARTMNQISSNNAS